METTSESLRESIYTSAMHLAHYLRLAGMHEEANEIEMFGIEHGKRKENTNG
jgi:hypothetical protein